MARRDETSGAGGPPADLAADAVTHLARRALGRLAGRFEREEMSDGFVEGFCSVLMAGDKASAARMVEVAARRRAGYARIADGLLSAAARKLGEKWARDEASFLEVSIAVTLLFRLNHDHAQRHLPLARDPARRQAVFATLPGQAHNLGLVLAAEAFRQADWQLTLMLDCSHRLILDRVRRLRPEIVGLSISTLDRRHQLEHLIGDLGARPFGVRILLGGTAADDVVAGLTRPHGVEAVHDIHSALERV